MLSCPDVAVFVVGDDEEKLKLFWMNQQRLTIWALLSLCPVGNVILFRDFSERRRAFSHAGEKYILKMFIERNKR